MAPENDGFQPTGIDGNEGGGPEVAAADFDTEKDYKATPMAPASRYRGSVYGVKYNSKDNTIDWEIALNGNGGVCSDGSTPVDGIHVDYRNWLPNVGDENEMTKKGKMTKRQAKINMLKDFADGMKLGTLTSARIKEALQNMEWVGREVFVVVVIKEYNGRFFNAVDSMVSV